MNVKSLRLKIEISKTTVILISFLVIISGIMTVKNWSIASAQATGISAKLIKGALPIGDINAEEWQNVSFTKLQLNPQQAVFPIQTNLSINELQIKALHNGSWLAIYIKWKDDTKNVNTTKPQEFRDAVAVQFPVNPQSAPDICMGLRGVMVNIWQWKADWQEDLDQNIYREVAQAYPNFWTDYYPFLTGNATNITFPDSFNKTEAKEFIISWIAGNPLVRPGTLVTPVEDANAEGFGTIQGQQSFDVLGRGVWSDNYWNVIFARKFFTGDSNDTKFSANQKIPVAFAVWNGAFNDVASKKAVTPQITLTIEGEEIIHPLQRPELMLIIPLSIMIVITVIGISVYLRRKKQTKRET